MNVRCKGCDKFSPADERTIYCRYCGDRYGLDIPNLARRTAELYQRWRSGSFRALMFLGSVPLVLLAGAFFWLTRYGASMPPETLRSIAGLLPLAFIGFLMLMSVGQFVTYALMRKKFREEYPDLFDNPDISL